MLYLMFILNENPVTIRDRMPRLKMELVSVTDKALVKNSKQRLQSAEELLENLRL